MSFARRAVLLSRPVFTIQRANSSSSHDHHEDHLHHEDSTVYPAETFATPFWRNVILGSIAGLVTLQYLPEASENVYLTRWIAMYTPSGEHWLALNARHTALQERASEDVLLTSDAKLSPKYRLQYPQSLAQASPFLRGVGMGVDVTGYVPK